jgi:hypothetical protein
MALTAQSIIQRVAGTLNDLTSVRWTIPELCRYFNDGQRDILMQRPDARNLRITHPLVAGSKQTLPADGEKLIDINANAAGNRRAITLVDRRILDAQVPTWRNLAGSAEILHYTYDGREPKTFEVYPPALSTASVDMEYAAQTVDIAIPADGSTFTAVTGNLSLSDLFGNAMGNYLLYRAYTKNTEYTANPQLAAAFYGAYVNDLGIEAKGNLMALMPATPMPQQTAG